MILLKRTELVRTENEQAAVEIIDEYRNRGLQEGFEVTQAKYVNKTKKSKGEIIDSWTNVTIEMTYMEL